MCPNSLVASITAAAIAIAEGRDEDEITMIATIFVQLADTLETIAVARAKCERLCNEELSKNTASSTESESASILQNEALP